MYISGKSLNQNPFSLYDILGYLVPGIIFIGILLIIDHCIAEGEFLQTAINDFITCEREECKNIFKNREWVGTGIFILLFVVFSYVIGQFLGMLSASWIEKRYYVPKFGYPSDMFKTQEVPEDAAEEINNRWYHKLLFTPIYELIDVIGLLIVCVFSILDRIFRNMPFIEDKGDGGYFKRIKIFLPYEKDAIANRCREICEYEGMKDGKFSFFVIYHHVIEDECTHLIKMFNYVALYGFFRNISLAFLLGFWINIIVICFQYSKISSSEIIISCSLLSLFSYISFLGFDKFFIRYTKETLYAALVNERKNDYIKPGKKTLFMTE